ncbi:MAG: DNRLRE domain-containing protein [Verrucomicrobiales bacterium]
MKSLSALLLATLGVQQLPGAITETTLSFQEGVGGYTGASEFRFGHDGSTDPTPLTEKGADVDTENASFYLDGGPDALDRKDLIVNFDDILAALPAGAYVTRAELVLTTGEHTANNRSGGAYNVYQLTSAFDDTGATYSPTNLLTYGSNITNLSGTFHDPTNTNGSVLSADVTRIVHAWQGGAPVFGFGIKSDRTGDGWSPQSSGSSDPTKRPQLRITYTTDPVQINTYQQGVNGYNASIDNFIRPGDFDDETPQAFLDGYGEDEFGVQNSNDNPYLLRFGNVENDLAGRNIEIGELTIVTGFSSGSADPGGTEFTVHQMLTDWDENSLYEEFAGDVEAMLAAGMIGQAVATVSGTDDTEVVKLDVSEIIQNWADGETNYGFYIGANGANGWQIFSNHQNPGDPTYEYDASFAPELRIVSTEAIPEPSAALLALLGLAAGLRRRR